jgi:hypothetical protein
MTRFERYKSQGHLHAAALTTKFGKVTAYENLTHGDDAPMVVFDTNGTDISDEFDAWDLDTFNFIVDDLLIFKGLT